jgi:hypothetical protein
MSASFPILKSISDIILSNILKVIFDGCGGQTMPLAIIDRANRAK